MAELQIERELGSFLNGDGQLTALPAKYKKKLTALYYLARFIEPERSYTESEINALLDDHTVFHDPATLRRELYNKKLLNRADDGSDYWKADEIPSPEDFLAKYL